MSKILPFYVLFFICISGLCQNQQTFTHYNLRVFAGDDEVFKKQDSGSWVFPNIKDSGATIIKLLDLIEFEGRLRQTKSKMDDSLRTTYMRILNRWANVCKWLCHDYDISESDLLKTIRRVGYSYNTINLYNKHKNKRKI